MSGVISAYMAPGLPHLVLGHEAHWSELKAAMQQAGQHVQNASPDVLVIYSAQWISVLGHSFQADPNPKGLHVDENWYDMGDFPFDFQTDTQLTHLAEQMAQTKGFATKLVNFEGFPVDTGTLVVLRHFNPDNRIPVVIVSSNIYCSQSDSYKLGETMGEAIRQSGKRAVLINCSSLSHRFWTEDIDPLSDRVSRPEEETWNQRILDLLTQGKTDAVLDLGPEYVHAASPEMQFKGFYWLMGAMGKPTIAANVMAYGPLWGTGAAIVEYSLDN